MLMMVMDDACVHGLDVCPKCLLCVVIVVFVVFVLAFYFWESRRVLMMADGAGWA